MKPSRQDPDKFNPDRYPMVTFDDADWQWFCDACRDLDIPLEPDKRPILERIYSHLVGVNSWMNLTTLTDPKDYLKFHVLDSLTVLDVVDELTSAGDFCLDLGSGGGYPGLPLMTWLPDRRWMLVDSRRKKAEFLKQAVRLTPCSHARAAAFRGREARHARPDLAGRCALVAARAVGKAEKLLLETVDLLRRDGFLVLLKGPTFAEDERQGLLEAAEPNGFSFEHEMSVTLDEDDPDRFIVLVRKLGSGAPRA